MPTSMKTVEMKEAGGPEVLVMGHRPVPELRATEVLVRVTAAGVNGPDLVQRRGHYPPPKVLGWAVGEPICALTNGGGYAEYVAVDAAHCLPIPETVSVIDAAGLCETYFTVWSNLFFGHEVSKDALLLVHGGAGGIGSTAVQLGNQLGMRVFTTCATADDCAFAQGLGAERAINFKEEDFVKIVREAGGADMILDIVGGDYVERNIKAANPDARIVQLAFNAGSKVEINLMPIMLKRLIYTGSTLRSRPEAFKSAISADLRKSVWPLFADSRLKPLTHKVFPFEQAAEAHKMMEQATHRGKILLSPRI
jgi:NADPH2:quinone reductase